MGTIAKLRYDSSEKKNSTGTLPGFSFRSVSDRELRTADN
jgi:hypothetical protein